MEGLGTAAHGKVSAGGGGKVCSAAFGGAGARQAQVCCWDGGR